MLEKNSCPLCLGPSVFYHTDKKRSYFYCTDCALVFVPKSFHLNSEQEKLVYDQHQNHIYDLNYRQFLSRAYQPLHARLSGNAIGLDFGCGPGPALAEMFRESGCEMSVYDFYYFPDKAVLTGQYDFITATEVIEHLSEPGTVLDDLWSILKPGGYLALMTKRVQGKAEFVNWHYKNDPTHICFFHEDSFRMLAKKWDAELEITSEDVVIFKK